MALLSPWMGSSCHPATSLPLGKQHSPGEGWWAGDGEAKSSLSLRSSSFSCCHCRPIFSQRLAAACLQQSHRSEGHGLVTDSMHVPAV